MGGFLDEFGATGPSWRRQMIRRRYSRGEPIFHEGEMGDTFHVIEKGRVLVKVSTVRGEVAALAVRGPGEVLGELAIVDGGRRTARVTALEPTETPSLTRERLDALRRADPDVDRRLLEILAERLSETMAQLMEILFTSVETRVLRVVLRLADSFDEGTDPIVNRIRQEDIAAMAGTRRQTANRPLKAAEAAEAAGAILVGRGRVELLDRDLLESLAR